MGHDPSIRISMQIGLRDCSPLLLGERQELRRKIATNITVECHQIRHPEAIEDREQQQGVFGRLAQCFSLFDQQARRVTGKTKTSTTLADFESGGIPESVFQ